MLCQPVDLYIEFLYIEIVLPVAAICWSLMEVPHDNFKKIL